MSIEIIGLEKLSDIVEAIPARIQKGTDKGIRKLTSEARRLLRQRMSFKGDDTPPDMLGTVTGYTRKGVRRATFRDGEGLVGKVYVGSKGFSQTPTPGTIAAINVAGAPARTRGGALPARDFFMPVRESVRNLAGDWIDAAVADELVRPLTEVL
jgi:hypothetical protein